MCVDKEMVAYEASLQAIVATLLAALVPAYAGSHQYVLEAIAVLAHRMAGAGPAALRLLSPVVKGLDELQVRGLERRQAESAQSAAWRALIRTLGPRDVLSLVPLNLSQASTGRARPWLVAELREGTRYAPLAYFFDDILPLAQDLEKRAQTAQTQVRIPRITHSYAKPATFHAWLADDVTFLLTHTYTHTQGNASVAAEMNLLATQLWGLFSSFCFLPTDLPAVFDKKAKMLGSALTDSGPESRRNVRHPPLPAVPLPT